MIPVPDFEPTYPLTDGEIAFNNLESARRHSWNRFWADPLRPGIAEYIVEQEQLTLQFVGDPGALDRLEQLVNYLDGVDADSPRTYLIHAQVASTAHRFTEAKRYLEQITDSAELSATVKRLSISIDQACGTELEAALEARQRIAAESGRLEDLVPLAALYADLREFDQADRIYQRALNAYRDTSPFAVAWICFQLGVLWAELVPESRLSVAAAWYQKAIQYLPGYVKARVHLAEICLRRELTTDAEAVLIPAVSSGDIEVSWRLADVLVPMGRFAEAEKQMSVARSGFETLLRKHLLAFANHGAEFYAGSGNDPQRSFELAMINVRNRPTLRAFEQAHETAVAAGEIEQAAEILVAARDRWGGTHAFAFSRLAEILVERSTPGVVTP
jgi:tetratricopeptide (TPR) repeat protein